MIDRFFPKDLGQDEYIEYRYIHSDGRCLNPHLFTRDQLKENNSKALEANAQDFNAYFGITTRNNNSTYGSKETAYKARFLWVDVDNTTDLPKILHKIALPPSVVVASGHGYHCYWQLDEPTEDQTTIEELNKRFCAIVGGDKGTVDFARILRVPDTLNQKDPTKPKKCFIVEDHPIKYSIEDLTLCANQNAYAPLMEIHEPPVKGDRSEMDYYAMKGLADLGFSKQAIWNVFTACAVGQKHRERSTDKYFDDTYKKVCGNSDDPTITKNQGFKLSFNQIVRMDLDHTNYCALNKDFIITTKLTDFILSFISLEYNSDGSHNLVCDVLSTSVGDQLKVSVPAKLFADRKLLAEFFGGLGYYCDCTNKQAQEIKKLLTDEWIEGGKKTTKTTSLLGNQMFEGQYINVDYDQAYTQDGEVFEGLAHQKAPAHPQLDTHRIDQPVNPLEIAKTLSKTNREWTINPVLGWMVLTQCKPLLDSLGVSFPHLFIFGNAGSGKTQTVENLFRMFYNESHHVLSTSTDFVLRAALGTSKTYPLYIKEFRVTTLKASGNYKLANFYEKLRSAYDGVSDSKGTSAQSRIEYPLENPIVIDGEEIIDDYAVLERVIPIPLVAQVTGRDQETIDAFLLSKTLDLESFGFAMRKWVFKNISEEYLSKTLQRYMNLIGKTKSFTDRNTQSVAMCLVGIEIFNLFVGEDVLSTNHKAFTDKLIQDGFICTPDAQRSFQSDEFLETILHECLQHRFTGDPLPHNSTIHFYFDGADDFRFNVSSAVRFYQRMNRMAPNRATLINEMKNKPYLNDHQNKPTNSVMGGTHRMLGVSLQRLRAYGLDVPQYQEFHFKVAEKTNA